MGQALLNIAEYRQLTAKKAKRSKYLNVKTNGYDSKKEANRASELKLLQKAGMISDLCEQVKFELVPTQRDQYERVVERAVNYVADFCYREKSKIVVEDVKSKITRTAAYIVKKKLMRLVHGIEVLEIY